MYAPIKNFCWLLVLFSLLVPHAAQAASGMPNSPSFGYGARVYLNGENPQAAIQEAGKFNLDWIALDFDWQQMQPEAENTPNWNQLDQAMTAAAEHDLSVLISVTHTPAWAMDENGPNPQKTAGLASKLARRYAGTLLALELFPSANTTQGWGTQPDPQAYTNLLGVTAQALEQEIILVGAGLSPSSASANDMDDVEFLRQLYAAGAGEYMPVVGLRLPAIADKPLTPLHQSDGVSLRHYEDIRNTMVEYGHKSGLIWITGFSWNSNVIQNAVEQAGWMKQAYLLMRSQLYIGAAFFDGLNPLQTEGTALFLPGGEHHPGFDELVQVIAIDHSDQTIQISLGLSKWLVPKNYAKDR